MEIHLAAGGDLQGALGQAQPGDALILETGATWTGNFTLPVKPDGSPIVVRSTTAGQLATLRSPNASPALRTVGASSHWHLQDLACVIGAGTDAIVKLGDGAIASETALPRDFRFERCTIQAEQTAKNGLEMNAAAVEVHHCRVLGVKLKGIESHAVIAWNSPGPFTVEDCILEAGSCGMFLGGAKPAIPNCTPSDFRFRRNLTTRPVTLQHETGWAIKNLFELKHARRCEIVGNTFEYNWPDGQAGFAIVFTVRANSPDAPWTTIEDVLFEHNTVRHVAMAFNILGLDNQTSGGGPPYPSQPMDTLIIRNNLVYDLDRLNWPSPSGSIGSGVFFNMDGAPRNLVIEANTAMGVVTGNIAALCGQPAPGFIFTKNIVQKVMTPYQTYGICGDKVGEGNPALNTYTTADRLVTNNVLAGCTPATYNQYPGNFFPSVSQLHSDFVDEANANYRLRDGSPYVGLGVDQDALEAAQQPPTDETIAETIARLAAESRADMADVGGDVSPQLAAKQGIDHYEQALLAELT